MLKNGAPLEKTIEKRKNSIVGTELIQSKKKILSESVSLDKNIILFDHQKDL
jgi:hypothetical protein